MNVGALYAIDDNVIGQCFSRLNYVVIPKNQIVIVIDYTMRDGYYRNVILLNGGLYFISDAYVKYMREL